MRKTESSLPPEEECTLPVGAAPAEELAQYRADRDEHSEHDIANYVEGQTRGEIVANVEKVRRDVVLGDIYDIWDVTTDRDRFWVVTNFTNLYSHRHFPSLDFTLSFHIGLMMRLRSRSNRVDTSDPSPFDDVFRREEQAEQRHDSAIEAEDYQAVGVQLRECLLSLVAAVRRRVGLPEDLQRPKDADFVGWVELLMNALCGGSSNKELRQHLKNVARETWQLVNWLTHARGATRTSSSITIHSCQTLVGHFVQVVERERLDRTKECPVCKSRDIRSHYDIKIGSDGDYYLSCGVCDWTDHP